MLQSNSLPVIDRPLISYCKLIWPWITQSVSMLLNMIKTIFLTSTIFFLSDESALKLSPPFVFSNHISLFFFMFISKLSHLITLLIILNLFRVLDFYVIILIDKNCTSEKGMSAMSICLTVHSSSKDWKPSQVLPGSDMLWGTWKANIRWDLV